MWVKAEIDNDRKFFYSDYNLEDLYKISTQFARELICINLRQHQKSVSQLLKGLLNDSGCLFTYAAVIGKFLPPANGILYFLNDFTGIL